MIMLEFTRRRQKDDMIKESSKESLELEKLSYCITQGLDYVQENGNQDGVAIVLWYQQHHLG